MLRCGVLGFLHLDAEWIPQNLAGLPVRACGTTGLRVVGSRGLAWVSSGETGNLAVYPWWAPQLGSFSRVGACQWPCGAPANSITGRIWENRLGGKATSESQPTDPDGAGVSALSPVHADSGERRLCPSPQRARTRVVDHAASTCSLRGTLPTPLPPEGSPRKLAVCDGNVKKHQKMPFDVLPPQRMWPLVHLVAPRGRVPLCSQSPPDELSCCHVLALHLVCSHGRHLPCQHETQHVCTYGSLTTVWVSFFGGWGTEDRLRAFSHAHWDPFLCDLEQKSHGVSFHDRILPPPATPLKAMYFV